MAAFQRGKVTPDRLPRAFSDSGYLGTESLRSRLSLSLLTFLLDLIHS